MAFITYIEEVKHPIASKLMEMAKAKKREQEFFITNETSFKHAQYCLSKLVKNDYISIIRRPRSQKFKLRILVKAMDEMGTQPNS